MKNIILITILFSALCNAQIVRPANLEIPFTIYDNSGLQNSSRILTVGIDSMATDSIDSFLGEYWLYCPWDIPGFESDYVPYDHFEAVLDPPAEPDPLSFLFGTWKDFRQGVIPYSGTVNYRIYCGAYEAATAIYLSWDFPEGVSGVLQDPLGGLLFNYLMPDSGTFTHESLMLLNQFRMILTYQNATPVELISFNAYNENSWVYMEWRTSSEKNNRGFEIERLKDLKIEKSNEWDIIGFVEGHGTTTEPQSYSFIDENVTTGIYKYRLKQIDFDGTYKYSNEIEVVVDLAPKEFVLHQNYPNPFNPTTIIKFSIPEVSEVNLAIYNVLGEKVAEVLNEKMEAGSYEHQWDASDIGSGVYIYELKTKSTKGSFVSTKKMLVLK